METKNQEGIHPQKPRWVDLGKWQQNEQCCLDYFCQFLCIRQRGSMEQKTKERNNENSRLSFSLL